MDNKIRLVWDFHGQDATPIAEHHAIHLKEFALKESLTLLHVGVEKVSDNHVYAFLDVVSNEMIIVRDALKPHRGLKIIS